MKSLSDYQDAYTHLAFERRDGILLVRFHSNGESLRWSGVLNNEFANACYDISADPENLVVIMTGTGDVFCEELDPTGFPTGRLVRGAMQTVRNIQQEMLRLLDIEVPVIGVVNGPARIHADVLLLSDVVLASETAVFQDRVHFYHGHVPGDSTHLVWPMLLGPNRGRAFLLTGQEIDAAEAQRLGIVHEVLPHDRVLDRAWELAAAFAKREPHVLRLTRRALTLHLRKAFYADHDTGATLEMFGVLASQYNAVTGQSWGEQQPEPSDG
jgi:enoyl-CoA hydratase/carnithine racemase